MAVQSFSCDVALIFSVRFRVICPTGVQRGFGGWILTNWNEFWVESIVAPFWGCVSPSVTATMRGNGDLIAVLLDQARDRCVCSVVGCGGFHGLWVVGWSGC
jgi:hypothetical protein